MQRINRNMLDLTGYINVWREQVFTATAGQTDFKLSTGITYPVNRNMINVFLNGDLQRKGLDYTEFDNTTIKTTEGLRAGDVLHLRFQVPYSEVLTSWPEIKIEEAKKVANVMRQQTFTVTEGQTVFSLNEQYSPGTYTLSVFLNGIKQRIGIDYLETDNGKVTFTSGLKGTDRLEVNWLAPTGQFLLGTVNIADAADESVPMKKISGLEKIKNRLDAPVINLSELGVTWGNDASDALKLAHDLLPQTGGTVLIGGNIKISKDVVFLKRISLSGFGYDRVVPENGTTITLLGASIEFKAPQSEVRNINFDGGVLKTGKGLKISNGGTRLESILVCNMAGHGIVIGDPSLQLNVNAVTLSDVRSRFNLGDGIKLVTRTGDSPNTNACLFQKVLCSNNAGNGLTINNSIDNNFYNLICEENKGYGVKLENLSMGMSFYSPYIEGNMLGEFIADSTCTRNTVFGHRKDAVIEHYVFENQDNWVTGRDNALGLFPVMNKIATRRFVVSNPEPKSSPLQNGFWEFVMDKTTRVLTISLKNAASASIEFLSGLKLGGLLQVSSEGIRFNTGKAIRDVFYTSDTTPSPITVPGNGFISTEKVVTGLSNSNTVSINAQTPAGVFVTARVTSNKLIFTYHNRNAVDTTFSVETYATVLKTEHA